MEKRQRVNFESNVSLAVSKPFKCSEIDNRHAIDKTRDSNWSKNVYNGAV